MRTLTPFLLLISLVAPAGAQQRDTAFIFHRPTVDYGSASIRNPLETYFNRGFSFVVVSKIDQLGDVDWDAGWRSTWGALTHPDVAIERIGGLRAFLLDEFVPDGGQVWKWAWASNYAGHIVAGGITSRFLSEWFEANDVPLPRLAGAAVVMAGAITNEVLEGGEGRIRASTVADVYLMEPIGILLFNWDPLAKFFGQTLEAADWSPQASFTLPDGRLMNSSQLMSYKAPLPFLDDRARVLFIIGQGAATGGQLRFRNGYRVGATVGFQADEHRVDPETGEESIRPDWGWGLFIDRNNSLLVSAVMNEKYHSKLRVNVFPGVLPGILRDVGVWVSATDEWKPSLGVVFSRGLGLGAGWDFSPKPIPRVPPM